MENNLLPPLWILEMRLTSMSDCYRLVLWEVYFCLF
ncbi:unnamed protein product [Brassica oleracea]